VRLSIAVVNWNTSALLAACLRSILRFPPEGDYEIIVVDNNSEDFDEPAFRSEFPDVKLIRNSDNAGYARGNNQALEIARGDYILLLNPDTEMTENAIEALVTFMESHDRAAAAGARLVRPDGTIDRSVRGFPYPGPIAWEFLGLSRLFPKCPRFGAYRMTCFTYDQVAEVDQPMGSALILSARAIRDIGVMDESFPIFFNEVDWLYRAKQKGWKVYFVPDATVIHHGASSTKQVRRRKMTKESHLSLLRFYAKHFKGRVFGPVYYFTVACIRISLLLRG
jgi:GT2 family glycosyltransferase